MNASQPQLRHHLGLAVGAALATWLAPLPAWAAATTCTASVINAPVLDPLAAAAQLGTYTLDCLGTATGNDPLTADWGFFFSSYELLPQSLPTLSDGNAVYAPAQMGPTGMIFANIPYDPVAMHFELSGLWVGPVFLSPGLVLQLGADTNLPNGPDFVNRVQTVAVIGPLAVPEPATAWLVLLGTLGALGAMRPAAPTRPLSPSRPA